MVHVPSPCDQPRPGKWTSVRIDLVQWTLARQRRLPRSPHDPDLLPASQGYTGCVVGRIDDDVISLVTIFGQSEHNVAQLRRFTTTHSKQYALNSTPKMVFYRGSQISQLVLRTWPVGPYIFQLYFVRLVHGSFASAACSWSFVLSILSQTRNAAVIV